MSILATSNIPGVTDHWRAVKSVTNKSNLQIKKEERKASMIKTYKYMHIPAKVPEK